MAADHGTVMTATHRTPNNGADRSAAPRSATIGTLDTDGPSPHADEIRAMLPGVALPIQKAYAVARQMRANQRTIHLQKFRTTDGGAVVVEFTSDDGGFAMRRLSLADLAEMAS